MTRSHNFTLFLPAYITPLPVILNQVPLVSKSLYIPVFIFHIFILPTFNFLNDEFQLNQIVALDNLPFVADDEGFVVGRTNDCILTFQKSLFIHELDDTAKGGLAREFHFDLLAILVFHFLDDGNFELLWNAGVSR